MFLLKYPTDIIAMLYHVIKKTNIPSLSRPHKEHLSQMPTDPTIDQDILSTIEKEYYEDGRFDAGKHELDVIISKHIKS